MVEQSFLVQILWILGAMFILVVGIIYFITTSSGSKKTRVVVILSLLAALGCLVGAGLTTGADSTLGQPIPFQRLQEDRSYIVVDLLSSSLSQGPLWVIVDERGSKGGVFWERDDERIILNMPAIEAPPKIGDVFFIKKGSIYYHTGLK